MKRTADSSRVALAQLGGARVTREHEVLDAVEKFSTHHGFGPTAYELLRWIQVRHVALDLNGVRPRLTEMKDAGIVRTDGKRVCAVTGKRVYVWIAVTPHPLPSAAPLVAAVQESLSF